MSPSRASRPAFLAAAARPRSRRSKTAFSTSPSVSSRTRLQSMNPAPVSSRRFLTDSALIVAMLRFLLPGGAGGCPRSSIPVGRPSAGGGPGGLAFRGLAGQLGGDLLGRRGDGGLLDRRGCRGTRQEILLLVRREAQGRTAGEGRDERIARLDVVVLGLGDHRLGFRLPRRPGGPLVGAF